MATLGMMTRESRAQDHTFESTSRLDPHLFSQLDFEDDDEEEEEEENTLADEYVVNTHLAAVPAELALDIFEKLDLASVFALSGTCRRFHQVYLANKSQIIFTVLQTDPHFSPPDGLFRVLAMSPTDLEVPWRTWLPKEVVFRRRVLCRGAALPTHIPGERVSVLGRDDDSAPGVTVRLEDADADRAIEVCKLVRGWERIFPYYRFMNNPECLRLLNANEERRLRAALYTWMRYHFYFHSDLRRPRDSLIMRTNMLRMLDSGELTDLEDLWKTVRSLVECLCPSMEAVLCDAGPDVSAEEASRVAWGCTRHWEIVSTMMKLGPDKLLYYVKNWHLYTKARLIDEIRRERPGMEAQIESLSQSIHVVMRMYQAPNHEEDRSSAGILDWEEGREPARPWFRAGGHGILWRTEEDPGDHGLDDAALLWVGALTE